MELNTASALISFYSRLEDQTASFYSSLADNINYPRGRETFLAFAEENIKHKKMIGRVYREAITDAAEACFSFTGLHEEAYMIDVELSDGLSYDDALKKAINVEEKSHDFCTRASEMSRDLLAGITQAFRRVARRKADREQTLKSLLDAE